MSKVLKLTAPTASESQEQSAVISWWSSYARTKGIDERLLMASANGAVLAGDAKHRAIQMARLKRCGFRNGVPDLFLAKPSVWRPDGGFHIDVFHGLWIELKRIGGKATPAQIEMADVLRRAGYCCVIAEGAQEAIRAIRAYLGDPEPSTRAKPAVMTPTQAREG